MLFWVVFLVFVFVKSFVVVCYSLCTCACWRLLAIPFLFSCLIEVVYCLLGVACVFVAFLVFFRSC